MEQHSEASRAQMDTLLAFIGVPVVLVFAGMFIWLHVHSRVERHAEEGVVDLLQEAVRGTYVQHGSDHQLQWIRNNPNEARQIIEIEARTVLATKDDGASAEVKQQRVHDAKNRMVSEIDRASGALPSAQLRLR